MRENLKSGSVRGVNNQRRLKRCLLDGTKKETLLKKGDELLYRKISPLFFGERG